MSLLNPLIGCDQIITQFFPVKLLHIRTCFLKRTGDQPQQVNIVFMAKAFRPGLPLAQNTDFKPVVNRRQTSTPLQLLSLKANSMMGNILNLDIVAADEFTG